MAMENREAMGAEAIRLLPRVTAAVLGFAETRPTDANASMVAECAIDAIAGDRDLEESLGVEWSSFSEADRHALNAWSFVMAQFAVLYVRSENEPDRNVSDLLL